MYKKGDFMKKRTYYVKYKGSRHTYDFLKQRKHDPKWQDAYGRAKFLRILEFILTILFFLVVVYFINDDTGKAEQLLKIVFDYVDIFVNKVKNLFFS